MDLQNYAAWMKSASEDEVQAGARSLAWSLGQVFAAATLLEMTEGQSEPGFKSWTRLLATRLGQRPLAQLSTPSREQIAAAGDLVRG